METEVMYVALSGFRGEGIGDVKGVFRKLDDAVAAVRAEHDELCKTCRSIIVNDLFKEKLDDVDGYMAWGEIRCSNGRHWSGCVKAFAVT